ncbi:hypothetical protein KIH74_11165 [Kineosporia sp. J2-2]|uniref:Lipoprotein n=1 Tax=Kineosporia corallincola TaxID=2835133 RepID=A0ABS5THF6_9ACTN|nr:hypothetical protein [Kineosporia corallincola]MBT0769483.1 hypothetical protein [Kineosporia corallincola]
MSKRSVKVGALLATPCAALLLAGCDAAPGEPTASSSAWTSEAVPTGAAPTPERRLDLARIEAEYDVELLRDLGQDAEADRQQRVFEQLVAGELQPDPDGFGDAACATVKRMLPALGPSGARGQDTVARLLGYTVMVATADVNQTIGGADTDAVLKKTCPAERAELLKKVELKSVDDVQDHYES